MVAFGDSRHSRLLHGNDGYNWATTEGTVLLMKPRIALLYTVSVAFAMVFSLPCSAYTAIVTGENYETGHPIVCKVAAGGSRVATVTIPDFNSQAVSIVDLAVTSDGVAVFATYDYFAHISHVYTLTPGSTTLTLIPTGDNLAHVKALAIHSDGTVILVGQDNAIPSHPVIYRLEPNTYELSSISTHADEGVANCVAIAHDGQVIVAGQFSNSTPLIYKLSSDGSGLTTIATPGGDLGSITNLAIASDGTVIFGGQYDNSLPIVYRLILDDTHVVAMATPGYDGNIKSIAVGSNNIAVLVGQYESGPYRYLPIVFTLSTAHDVTGVTPLYISGLTSAYFKKVVIDSKNNALLLGRDEESEFLFLSRLTNNFTQIDSITNSYVGTLGSVAIGLDRHAILGGQDEFGNPALYTTKDGATTLSQISTTFNMNGIFSHVAVANYDISDLCDINRLNTIYVSTRDGATNLLDEAGL